MEAFKKLFKEAKEIKYNSDWENGTGYLDGAVNEEVDCSSKCIDRHGRNVVIIPVIFGNIVLFERYAGNNGTIVRNCNSLYPLNNHIQDEDIEFINAIHKEKTKKGMLDLFIERITKIHSANEGRSESYTKHQEEVIADKIKDVQLALP